MSDITLEIKSTIDKLGNDLATNLEISKFIDLDDTSRAADFLAGKDAGLVWKFMSLDEDPKDPLYHLSFMIGIKTSDDPANYNMLGFVSGVKAIFPVGGDLTIMDWSGDVAPTTVVGKGYITVSGVDAQLSDKESGVRMLAVEAKVNRLV